MLGSPAGPGGPTQRGGLWPLASTPSPNFSTDGFGKYGIYSLLPGSPAFGSALYSHSSIGRFATTGSIQTSPGTAFHTAHKVSDSLFTSTGYTFGAPTPPPGSPYSPVPVTQLELFAKGFNSNIIIQQPDYFPHSTKKVLVEEKRCEEKYCCKPQRPCNCQGSPLKTKFLDSPSGCSRTNPVDWGPVTVKKEPGLTPCQVAEITTSQSPVVKLEVTSPTQKSADAQIANLPSAITNGDIPVGIAVARQRIQHEVVSSPSLPPSGLLASVNNMQTKDVARYSEMMDAGMAATTTAGVPGGGTLLQCHEDRSGGFASWPVGGAHNSALTTPTLWQYPSHLPLEPLVPMPLPMQPPGGYQLVRDPNTGSFLLLPTTGVEQLQQTLLWPSYHHQPSSHVLFPPVAPPPLQLLSSAADYLQTSTTLHQHTQSHSTRLVALTTDTKRKIPLPIPTTTFIKIETDATLDQTKTMQAVSTIGNNTGTVYTDQNMAPLVTTHVIYQHPTNLILSQGPSDMTCRPQVASPVSCLTPPPESTTPMQEETMTVQDASNQTDTSDCCEYDTSLDSIESEKSPEEPEVQIYEEPEAIHQVPEPHVQEPPEDIQAPELPEPAKQTTEEIFKPDISGLELLSNSIVAFENFRQYDLEPPVKNNEEVLESMAQMSIEDPPVEVVNPNKELTGLSLLCALAEQRITEEVEGKALYRKEKRKSKRHSDEPKPKKLKESDITSDEISDNNVKACTCKDDAYKTYKTKESEEEVRKFLASKSQPLCCKGNRQCMNSNEMEMRKRLADLQRKYREKQFELSNIKPKKHDKKSRIRKKSVTSDRSTPPPQLEKMDIPVKDISTCEELLKPPTLCCYENSENVISEPILINEEIPRKPKKRKVGRPKKLTTSSGSHTGTETIVAKKPRKNNMVGFLLAAKEKLIQNEIANSDPPRFTEESTKSKKKKSKIRPKLKAEATIKSIDYEEEEPIEQIDNNNIVSYTEEDINVYETEEISKPEIIEEEKPVDNVKSECAKVDSRCILTTELLEQDKLRVLTAMGGLFYAGRLNAVEPPDVYSITLDGERGNRPHIMSREEILRDAIVEVSPSSADELTPGTRLCAYWSQQYRCLYPGSVAEPETPDPVLDCKFVSVEFDDGDSGKISIEDIRLLPPDYPIIEYDPNPLLSLCKRRRRASTTEEKRSSVGTLSPTPESPKEDTEKENQDINVQAQHISHRERKRLKKRRKEKIKQKLLLHEDKKKKKKHRCIDENCKHRKHHKKHRKHKKHHHNKENSEEKIAAYGAPEMETDKIEDADPIEDTAPQPVEIDQDQVEEVDQLDGDNSNSMLEKYPEYRIIPNTDDEVTMDDIIEALPDKNTKLRDRQESCESRSKMSAFLPARQIWGWSGKGYKRSKGRGRLKKTFYKEIQRGNEIIQVGDSAVFLSTGRPDRPYIGHIESMWESCGNMVVKVKWFYHPEETEGCPLNLKYPGALFESSHTDENDVQTISHKCEVLPLWKYTSRLGDDPGEYASIYDNNDVYYLAGFYDPSGKVLKMEADIPFNNLN